MGVKGLLPLLKPISNERHLSSLRGCTVAVDSYCWLHKAVLGCSEAIVLDKDTDLFLNYCLKYINLLLSFDIKVILVFDGKNLPAKREVERKRGENREINMKKALQLMIENKKDEAKMYFDRSVNISHDIAVKLIKKALSLGVKCIVAPYEADAQLAYLGRNNLVDYVITDDSDLLLFGTPRVLFKLDFNGNCILIEKKDLNKVLGFSLERYSFDKFRHICIISGCDYFSGINRIGLLTAIKLVKQTQLSQLSDFLKRINIYSKTKIIISKEEIEEAVIAEQTLLHQIVFDPVKKKQVPLTDYPIGTRGTDFSFAGQSIEDEDIVLELACGKRNPCSRELVLNFNWDKNILNDFNTFYYGIIRDNISKSIEIKNSIEISMNKSKSLTVKCPFPWTNASKSYDSQNDLSTMFDSYISDKENTSLLYDQEVQDEKTDEVTDILRKILDDGESVIVNEVPSSENNCTNPFFKQSIIKKRSQFSPGKENESYLSTSYCLEPKKLKCTDSDVLLSSKKIIDKSRLAHLFKK